MAGAKVTVALEHGLRIGENVEHQVVLREATAGDVMDAQADAEKLVYVPASGGGVEPTLVTSPTRVGVEVLRRQIVSIGETSGPLEMRFMRQLHPEDLNTLLARSEELDGAAVAATEQGTAQRGRDQRDRPGPAEGDVGGRDVDGVDRD